MGALSPVFSQITKIEISNLVLKKGEKNTFLAISQLQKIYFGSKFVKTIAAPRRLSTQNFTVIRVGIKSL